MRMTRSLTNWTVAGAIIAAVTTSASAQTGKADSNVAAVVGGEKITYAELDTHIAKTNAKLAQDLYSARKDALDDLILETLLKPEAKAKNVPVDTYVEQRIAEKAGDITDAEVEAFYNQNQARMGGRTLEQIAGQIRQYLQTQRQGSAKNALLAEVKANASVRVNLEPPRLQVAVGPNDPVKGPSDAPVTIVEFSDFQCPFCSRVGPTLKQIEDTYGDKVRISFRDFILPMHNRAMPAALAAQCANEQGKFWDYHDKLFGNQRALEDENLKSYAQDIGLDMNKFNECYNSKEYQSEIEKDMSRGRELGVTGTPAFFINGRFLSGAQPFDAFKAIINEELERTQ
ncbi:MAG: thioredoxin domain-containing protein [Phycisphaerae bacterium]|nr:thioredoxin domain-containing protein [Phycisphaerae bacterium]